MAIGLHSVVEKVVKTIKDEQLAAMARKKATPRQIYDETRQRLEQIRPRFGIPGDRPPQRTPTDFRTLSQLPPAEAELSLPSATPPRQGGDIAGGIAGVLTDAYDVARTDVPGMDRVQDVAGQAGRVFGERILPGALTPGGPAVYEGIRRLPGIGGPTQQAASVPGRTYEELAKALVPQEVWDTAIVLLPAAKARTVPELISALTIGDTDAITALRNAGKRLQQSEQVEGFLGKLASESGALGPGADDPLRAAARAGEDVVPASSVSGTTPPPSPLPAPPRKVGQLLTETGDIEDVVQGGQSMPIVQGVTLDRAAPKPPGVGGRDQVGIRLGRDAEQRIETFEARARELGAPDAIARTVAQAYRDGEVFASTARQYSDSNPVRQLLAKGNAWLEGNVPNGVVNQVARAHLVAENAIRLHIDDTLQQFRNIDQYIEQARGTATFIGPPKMRELAEKHFGAAVVTHPEWFRGLGPELKTLLTNLQSFQNDMYKVVRAIDPNAAPALDAPYLRTLWDVPESNLTSAVSMPIGRASVTKARKFPDPFEAMADARWPYELKDVPVSELVQSSAHLAARQIGTQLERKMILQRFGTTTRRPGMIAFRNPNYAGWYAKPEIVNFIDQLHEPGGSVVKGAGAVTNPVRNTVFGIGDIGVFGQQVTQLLSTRGPVALAGAINRGLERMGLGMDLYRYADEDLPRALQRSLDGLPQGSAGRIGDQGANTLIGYIPKAGKPVEQVIERLNDAQFAGVLTPLRNMAYEGNLIVSKLLGRDITSPAVRRAAAENAAAFSGTSLGALRRARREGEQAFLGAPGITRALGAQLLQVSKLNTPEAITTLVSTGAMVYGLGSLINMTLGSGELPAFDPRKVDWASVRIGGEWREVNGEKVYVGGRTIRLIPQASLVRAIGKSMTAVEEGNPNTFLRAWQQLAFTRSTPLVQGVGGALTRTGFTDEGRFQFGSLDAKQAAMNAIPLPIVGQAAVEGDITSPADAALNVFGVSNFPGQSEEDVRDDQRQEARSSVGSRLEQAKQQAFESKPWRDAFIAELGPEAQSAGSLEELKKRYVEYWLPQYSSQGPEATVRSWLERQFEALPVVARFDRAYQQYRLQYWREHPEELVQAATQGLVLTQPELSLYQDLTSRTP